MEEDQSDCSAAEVMQDLFSVPQRRTMSQGFGSSDCVNLEEVFQVRALVMRGAFRVALKVGLEEIRKGPVVSIVAADVVVPTHREEALFHNAGWRNVRQFNNGEWASARDEWDHGNCEEESTQQKRHGMQNGKGFPLEPGWGGRQHGMC